MVLGTWSRKDRLYGGDGFSVESNGDLDEQFRAAVGRLPECGTRPGPTASRQASRRPSAAPPLERHVTEGSFFVGDDRTIFQIVRPGRPCR